MYKVRDEFKDALTDSEELLYYLKRKANNHNNYRIYTEYSRVENILNTKELYLKDGSNWNDKLDRESFNSNDDKKNCGLCFSFSRLENIAMWMLYGGLNNCGTMINFSKKEIRNILENKGPIELGYVNDKKFCTVNSIDKEQYKIMMIDIVYYDCDNCLIKLKHSDKNAEIKDLNELYNIESVLNDLSFCKKTAHWRYENECRLIVSVDRAFIDDDRIATVKLPIGDTVDLCNIEKNIIHSPDYRAPFKYKKSALTGKVDWDLRKGCKYYNEDKCL